MTFSVIVPVYKNWEIFQKCYAALMNQDISKSDFEILVINNSPEDKIPATIEIQTNTRILDQLKPGSYSSRDLGVEMARGKYLAFTDSDCLPSQSWLRNSLRILENGADIVGGKVEVFKEEKGSELAFDFERTFGFNQKRNVNEKSQSVTANLVTKKSVFQKTGLFMENLLSGGDFEWTKRAVNLNFSLVYGENVVVAHPARKSVADIARKRKRTSGGFYLKEYEKYPISKKLEYLLVMGRPRISILGYHNFTLKRRIELFFATWHIEIQGILEILMLQFGIKEVERQ